ncbi:MAG: quinohemoprotein amine dehydrogenase maturation protein [Colwellia sp.]|nr:quinohemoprotein amine dehydrogenase maturation protein [Colwellia sp.]
MNSILEVIENNLHQVEVKDKSFIFHIPTTSLFESNDLTGDILSLIPRQDQPTDSSLVQELNTHYPEDDIISALDELKSLSLVSKKGLNNGVEEFVPLALDSVPLTTVVLSVNTGCNLSCTYCYKEDLDVPSAGKKMTFDIAKQSIDMLLKESPDQSRYNVVFFGGEPLSNFTLIKDVIAYSEKVFASKGKIVDFSMTTNATLLTERHVEYFDKHNVGLSISIDGPKAYHDRNRISVNGEGTYDTVAKKAKMLLSRYKSRPIGARVTLTTGITDIDTIWDHLFNTLGFSEVGFAPVTSGDISDYNLKPEELVDVFNNMKKLGEKYLAAALENKTIGFSNLHQLITDIHEGTKKALPCGAGVGMVAVDHEGGLNLCHRFTGSDIPLLGDVKQGLDKPVLNDFLNKRLEQSKLGCSTCHIRNLCAGGCYHESYARYGDPAKPTFHYCDLMRDWVDFGIYVYTEIMEHNPGFYDTYIAPRKAQA